MSQVTAQPQFADADSDVERRIAAFWLRVDALAPSDLLTAADLGQWGMNVIERDPNAAIVVAEFRASTAEMQSALDRASAGVPAGPPRSAGIETRIALFWQRIEVLGPTDLLIAADLGQWALNVADRDAAARIRVDDFRAATARMQSAFDRARATEGAPSLPERSQGAAGPPITGERAAPAGSLRLTGAMNVLTTAQGGTALPSIGVGPESFVVITNPRSLVYSRSGEIIADLNTQTMFSPVIPPGISVTDLRILFDQRSQRFFVTGAAGPECEPPNCTVTWAIAVSKTSAPRSLGTADWYFYGFDGTLENGVPSGQTGDFNVVSVTDDMLVLTGISIPLGSPAYAKIWVFPKAPFLNGAPISGPTAEYVRLRDPLTGERLEKAFPAVMATASDRVFLASWSSSACNIVVLAIDGPASASSLTMRTARASGECRGGSPQAPQRGGGSLVDAGILFNVPPYYRDGHLWVVQVVPRAGSGTEGALRLAELDVSQWPAEPSYVLDTKHSEAGVWYFSASVAVDPQHNVVIATNRSGPSDYPSFWMTGRRAADPPDLWRAPVAIKHGEANWNWVAEHHLCDGCPPIRNWFSGWSGAAIDPLDGSAWIVGQATRTSCYWDLWVARTDFEVTSVPGGMTPSVPPPRLRDRPCSEDDPGPLPGPAT